jgi:hypothetical protein
MNHREPALLFLLFIEEGKVSSELGLIYQTRLCRRATRENRRLSLVPDKLVGEYD